MTRRLVFALALCLIVALIISLAYMLGSPSPQPQTTSPTPAHSTTPTQSASSTPNPQTSPTQQPTTEPTSITTPIPSVTPLNTPQQTQTPQPSPKKSQLTILSVNHTTSGDRLLDCLIHAIITGVTVENVGNLTVRVTSVKLYYGVNLQASRDIEGYVYIPPNLTAEIDVKIAPTEVGNGNPYWVLEVETSDGAVASSDPLPLCGYPLPPM